jgi:3-oxoacyl-[acyl-carrier protein] reductase
VDNALEADLTDQAAVSQAVEAAEALSGPLDAVVQNAAITDLKHHLLVDLPIATWRRIMDVNVTGSVSLIQQVIPAMHERQRGNVVFVTSSLGTWKGGVAGDAVYSASKAAVEALANVLSLELKASGINVNTVYPSVKVRTGFFAHLSEEDRLSLAPPDLLNEAVSFLTELPAGTLSGASVSQQRWDEDQDYVTRLRQQATGGLR